MSGKQKKLEKLLERPKTMKFKDVVSVLESVGFKVYGGGNHGKAYHPEYDVVIILADPHPKKDCKKYFINQVVNLLEELRIKEISK
ncbi:hypothetical protein AWR38_06325 [Idiomarina sp. WRN-38]|nr:hypothetical protein AUR68_06310 [Idiomarina sp. H105]OAE91033.1 hypothetical protein AWR38_06325 [Idiomarina sp. WRN-38]